MSEIEAARTGELRADDESAAGPTTGQAASDVVAPEASGSNTRKVFIKTYGCQMNVYDSQRMGEALARDGYVETGSVDDADLILLNTCHIREKAVEKVYSALGRLRKTKKLREQSGHKTLVGITGCVAQAEGAQIAARAPIVDMVIGPQSYHRIGEYAREAAQGRRIVATEFAIAEKFAALDRPMSNPGRARAAFVTVQEGCDKFCTFCVVPYTRGAEVSRPAQRIIAEARRLVDDGVCEITLLGQNVNGWNGASGADGASNGASASGGRLRLAELIGELAVINGLERIRYTTSHPIDMDDDLIEAHRTIPKLMPYLHLPVQAGSDRILKAMNRRHDRDFYLALVHRIRAANPNIALSGDFIVGFPGESEEDFADTLDLVTKVGYASAFSFKYSARPGTPAAEDAAQVADDEKIRRLDTLQKLLISQQEAFNRSRIGMEMDVLFERKGRRAGQIAGRSPWLQTVLADADDTLIGRIVRCRIVNAGPNSLFGEPVHALASAANQA